MDFNALSREYLWFSITTTNDLSGATAEVTYLAAGVDPEEVDWVAAELIQEGVDWFIRSLVSGPGQSGATVAIELSLGDLQAWTRITDTPERPVRRPGVVTVA